MEFESPSIESLWLSLRPNRLPRSISVILLAVIYHPPSAGGSENNDLYEHIQYNVDIFLRDHPEALVIVTGDFNSPSTGIKERRFQRLSGLRQIIDIPTREKSILDWCLVNLKDVRFQSIQLPPIGTSDHNAIIVRPALQRSQKPIVKKIYKRDLRDSCIRSFGQWITTFDWSGVLAIRDCEQKFDKFNGFLSSMVEQFFPLKLTKTLSVDKPWISSSLKCYIRKRQVALYKFGKFSPIYKYWRNEVQRAVKSVRGTYYKQSVGKLKTTNVSRWWKEVKKLGGLSSQESWYDQLSLSNTSTHVDLADHYNDFLVSLTSHFKPLRPNDQMENYTVPDYLLVNTQTVLSALRCIKTTKSCGPDGIPNKILKTFAEELAPVICDIYNTSLQQGIFPEHLKRSIAVPIPKTSPPTSIENDLRPISLTSQIAKILEGFTLDSLLVDIGTKLDVKQFALPGKSTTHALVYLLHQILGGLDVGHCAIRLSFATSFPGSSLCGGKTLAPAGHVITNYIPDFGI